MKVRVEFEIKATVAMTVESFSVPEAEVEAKHWFSKMPQYDLLDHVVEAKLGDIVSSKKVQP